MLKFLQSQISWWISILVIVMIPVITFFLGLNMRVSALEVRATTTENNIIEHNKQEEDIKKQLTENGVLLKMMTDYFKLTPRDVK